jgi:hypothetical protein
LAYVVSGSIASIIYGEPRLTHDVDIILFVQGESARNLQDFFPSPDFYVPPFDVIRSEAAREQRGHINIIHIDSGFKTDCYFAGTDPLHQWALKKARLLNFEGVTIPVAPPEYVIIRKLEYFREGGSPKHLRDIRSMLKVSADSIDLPILHDLIKERGLVVAWNEVTGGK